MGGRVLIVDNESSVARLITLLLADLGCQVETAGSTADGIHQARGNEYDLLVVKEEMPETSGSDLIRQLHGLGSRGPVPAILTSIYGEPPGHPADDFLHRPFDPDRFTEAASRLLAYRAAVLGEAVDRPQAGGQAGDPPE